MSVQEVIEGLKRRRQDHDKPTSKPKATSSRATSSSLRPVENEASIALDAIALLLAMTLVALLFNSVSPDPYMDEPFHVGQTQKYCKGRFDQWDPKITTFPGIYFFGAGLGRCWHFVANSLAPPTAVDKVELCSTPSLRAVNLIFATMCYILTYAIYRELHPHMKSTWASFMAMLVVLLPTSFFFNFLYYTDIGALTFFLASYWAVLLRRYTAAGLLAGAAVMMRQTNAVWTLLTLFAAILQILGKQRGLSDPNSSIFQQLLVFLQLTWQNKGLLLARLWALTLVPLLFAAFVVYNKGIVVGDRANHSPQPHLVQPLYFALFTVGFLPQIFATPARHYTFYLWKDVIAAYPAARYCFIPLYLFSGFSIIDNLKRGGRSSLWVLAFFICTGLTLVPAGLIELRYFTIPFVVVVLHIEPPPVARILENILLFAVVNAVSIYVFLFCPRQADGALIRFMW